MNRAELISKMDRQVNRIVKYYKEDFYHWDISTLLKLQEQKTKIEYLWIIRESGTHFFDSANTDYLAAIRNNWSDTKTYLIKFDGSENWEMKLLAKAI